MASDLSDKEYAELTGNNPDYRIKDRSSDLGPKKLGIIPGLKKLAGGAGSVLDIIQGAKSLARADDSKRRKEALEQIEKA
tara:strand:- start:1291 stop:1530 length:240 start_codon:yes stop_codon:yes gene_type:complete